MKKINYLYIKYIKFIIYYLLISVFFTPNQSKRQDIIHTYMQMTKLRKQKRKTIEKGKKNKIFYFKR